MEELTRATSSMSEQEMLKLLLAERDILCPVCGYGLRGLKSGACPECGVRLGLAVTPRRSSLGTWEIGLYALLANAGIVAFVSLRFWPAFIASYSLADPVQSLANAFALLMVIYLLVAIGTLAFWIKKRHWIRRCRKSSRIALTIGANSLAGLPTLIVLLLVAG